MTANQAVTRVTKHLRFTPTSDLRGRRFRMSALSDLFSSSRVRPVGVGPRPRGATVGDRVGNGHKPAGFCQPKPMPVNIKPAR